MARPSYRGFRGDHLRTLREERGWTQEGLAVRVGVYPTMIGKWERGDMVPAADRLSRLCALLGARPQEFTSVPVTQAGITDLRLWAGLTRAMAAAQSGIPTDRLRRIEHLAVPPTGAELAALARTYAVTPDAVRHAWDRERALVYGAP